MHGKNAILFGEYQTYMLNTISRSHRYHSTVFYHPLPNHLSGLLAISYQIPFWILVVENQRQREAEYVLQTTADKHEET